MDPEALKEQAPTFAELLEHNDIGYVLQAVLNVLSKLPPEALTKYAPAIAKRLEDDNNGVRVAALKALGTVPAEALAHARPKSS